MYMNSLFKNISLSIFFVFRVTHLFAQEKADTVKANDKVLFNVVSNGTDTMFYDTIPETMIYTRNFSSWKDEAQFRLLKRRIIKVYPYLVTARDLLAEVHRNEESMRKHQFNKYKKEREKQLRGAFEKDLKGLTVGEGKVLVKLFARETNESFYDFLKELKGGFTAWTYNVVANKYDYDLKEEYVPEDNKDMEIIIKNLEHYGSQYEFMNY